MSIPFTPKQHTNANDMIAEATAILLDRMTMAGIHWNDIEITIDMGDGGELLGRCKSNPRRQLSIALGGACTDLDYPYYEIGGIYNDTLTSQHE